MDKDTLEIALWGLSFKANGTRAIIVLAAFLLLVLALAFDLAGPQIIAILMAKHG